MKNHKTVRNVFFTVFCLFACISLGYAKSCSTAGATQNKYTASGCSYTTQSRTCCATTGAWSDWGGSCPSCSSSQCWDGSKCADKEAVSRSCLGNITNAQSGTQTRTATCTNGTGWTYGAWTGTCTCTTGYTWNSSTKRCIKACDTSAAEWCNNCGLTFNVNTCRCSCPVGSSWNGKWCVTKNGTIYACR